MLPKDPSQKDLINYGIETDAQMVVLFPGII